MAADNVDPFGSGFVTVAQAARRLQRSRPFVERLIRDGYIGTEVICGRTYLNGFDVETIARQHGLATLGNPRESYGPEEQTASDVASDRGATGNGFADRRLQELRSRYLQ